MQPKPSPKPITNTGKLLAINHEYRIGAVKQLPDNTRFYIGMKADHFDRLMPLVVTQALVTMPITYSAQTKKKSVRLQVTSLTLSNDPCLRDREDEDFQDDHGVEDNYKIIDPSA